MINFGTVYSSAARTANPTKQILNNKGARGVLVVIDVTAITSTPSVVFTIQGYDPTSGKYYTILASAAITGVGTTVLRVHPELTGSANTIAKDFMPPRWAVDATHANGNSITYTVSYALVN